MGCIDDSIDELPFVTDEVDWRGVVFNEDEDGNEGERPDELVDEVAGELGWWFFFTSDCCLADKDVTRSGGCTAPAFSISPNFDTARFGFGFLCSIIFLHISGILFP